MEHIPDDEFLMQEDPASCPHLPSISSPISAALDSSPLKRMLGLPIHGLDTNMEVDEGSIDGEQIIEEEGQELVQGIQGTSGRLRAQMAIIMKELRAQRMGVGTFIRAWVEQDNAKRSRRIGLLRRHTINVAGQLYRTLKVHPFNTLRARDKPDELIYAQIIDLEVPCMSIFLPIPCRPRLPHRPPRSRHIYASFGRFSFL